MKKYNVRDKVQASKELGSVVEIVMEIVRSYVDGLDENIINLLTQKNIAKGVY